jgi:hypothetical protein
VTNLLSTFMHIMVMYCCFVEVQYQYTPKKMKENTNVRPGTKKRFIGPDTRLVFPGTKTIHLFWSQTPPTCLQIFSSYPGIHILVQNIPPKAEWFRRSDDTAKASRTAAAPTTSSSCWLKGQPALTTSSPLQSVLI